MMETDVVNPQTGEVLLKKPNGEAAREAAERTRLANSYLPSGFGGDFIIISKAISDTVFDLPPWIANSEDSHHGKYATLRQLMQIIQPASLRNGLHVTHGSKSIHRLDAGAGSKGWVMPVYTLIIHAESGSWKRTEQDIPMGQFDAQAAGSAFTYGKRYTTLAAFGLATDNPKDDDDAESVQPPKLEDTELSDAAMNLIDGLEACETEKDYLSWRKSNIEAVKALPRRDFAAVKSRAQAAATRVKAAVDDTPKTKRAPRSK